MTSTTRWLNDDERAAWIRLAAVIELLPAALDAQLNKAEGLTHFDYFTLAMLSEAPDRTLRMTALASRTNATLPRLSRVISRLEAAGLVERRPCPSDRRATNAVLTTQGFRTVVRAAPGHVGTVRQLAIDPLTADQVVALADICGRMLAQLDPEGRLFAPGGPPD